MLTPPGRSSGASSPARRRGKRVAGLPAEAYGEHKDASAAWAAGVLVVDGGPAAGAWPEGRAVRPTCTSTALARESVSQELNVLL